MSRPTPRTLALALLAVCVSGAIWPVRAEAAPALPELVARLAGLEAEALYTSRTLALLDARIVGAEHRLALAESTLPATIGEEVEVLVAALAADFSPAMSERSDRVTSARREHEDLTAELNVLRTERAGLAGKIGVTLEDAYVVRAQVAEAQRLRAERIATVGAFPVAGPHEYIDSWGFPRSGGRSHRGSDILAPKGTPVVAVHSGSVTPGRNRLGGLTVWLDADNGARYYYAHLDSISVGHGRVSAGQVLGTVGNSGNARGTPPHLHFEVHRPSAVNPFPLLNQMVR
ncbi:MAG: M23 family metallopeptidase [Coriobacteriia bacterium]